MVISLTISLVKSSDDTAYLPLNCFLTNCMVDDGLASSKLVDGVIFSSFTSLKLYDAKEKRVSSFKLFCYSILLRARLGRNGYCYRF